MKVKRIKRYTCLLTTLIIAVACQKPKDTILSVMHHEASPQPEVISYDLEITQSEVAIDDYMVKRYLVNASSPAPTIHAKYGDQLEIRLTNHTDTPTTIHWHGLLLPNDQDGVATLTTPIIEPDSSFTYRFTVQQVGTYWYHAHGLEEADGIYGGIIFDPPDQELKGSDNNFIIFSGELSQDASTIFSSLTHAPAGALPSHHAASLEPLAADFGTKDDHQVANNHDHHQADEARHYSDISYRYLLINGERDRYQLENTLIQDDQIHLRLVNAFVDGYINLVYSGGDITVVASDGLAVEPVSLSHLRMAMGESYDIILPYDATYQSQLVAFFMGQENRYATLVIGSGLEEPLASYNALDYPDDQPYNLLHTMPVAWMKIVKNQDSVVNFNWQLVGDHDPYHWQIKDGNQVVKEVNVKVGQRIRIRLTNLTTMPHPMHLHGNFFTVISNNQPLIKHTINLEPNEQIIIEFTIDEAGKWLFHCHNLFHMISAMSVTVNAT